jgi:hypothetical protein
MSSNFNCSYMTMSRLIYILGFSVNCFFQPIYTDYANWAYFDKRSHLNLLWNRCAYSTCKLKLGHPKIISTQISEQKILMWFLSHNIPKRNKLAEKMGASSFLHLTAHIWHVELFTWKIFIYLFLINNEARTEKTKYGVRQIPLNSVAAEG